jgi:hypothetical protein
MASKRGGSKPKLTPTIQAKVCDAIRAGNYVEAAAEHAGIGRATFFRWMAKGEEATSGVYREFWEAVKKAESDSEVVLVAHWRKAATKNWVAAAALLERRFRSRWSRSDHVKVEANVTTNTDDRLLEKLGKLVAATAAAAGPTQPTAKTEPAPGVAGGSPASPDVVEVQPTGDEASTLDGPNLS